MEFTLSEIGGGIIFHRSEFSQSLIDSAVAQYVQDQEEHHRKKTFLQEYKSFLDKFEIDYDEQYIFKPLNKCIAPMGQGKKHS